MLDPHEPDTSTQQTNEEPRSGARPPSAAGGKPASRAAFLGPERTNNRATHRVAGDSQQGFDRGGTRGAAREDRQEVRSQTHNQETP